MVTVLHCALKMVSHSDGNSDTVLVARFDERAKRAVSGLGLGGVVG